MLKHDCDKKFRGFDLRSSWRLIVSECCDSLWVINPDDKTLTCTLSTLLLLAICIRNNSSILHTNKIQSLVSIQLQVWRFCLIWSFRHIANLIFTFSMRLLFFFFFVRQMINGSCIRIDNTVIVRSMCYICVFVLDIPNTIRVCGSDWPKFFETREITV